MSELQQELGPLVNRKAAAGLLGISIATLTRLEASGYGPPRIKLGKGRSGVVRYPVRWIEAWIVGHAQ
jgi:predicted DNA-binding transcriptional regulator AlpA